MPLYQTPGAYIERDDRAQGGISRLRTDVVGFVGIAERGPARRAVAVESWKQFQVIFGSLYANGYLGYVVRAFFDNGGRRCWIVRVESDAAQVAELTIAGDGPGGSPIWALEASSSGIWGNALSARLLPLRRVVRRTLRSSPNWAEVDLVAGYARATTVELVQDTGVGIAREVRVLSAVDARTGRLTWNHDDSAIRLPSDRPLAILDPSRPLRISTLTYELQIAEQGRPIVVYSDLALSPAHERYGPAIVNGAAALFAPNAGQATPGLRDTARSVVALGRRSMTTVVPQPVRLVELREAPDSACDALATRLNPTPLGGGLDGLSALGVSDFIGFDAPLEDSAAALLANRCGIAALSEIDEISLAAVPDINIQPRIVAYSPPPRCVPNPCLPAAPPTAIPLGNSVGDLPPQFSSQQIDQVVAALVSHCELRADRVALIDPPYAAATQDRLGLSAIRDFRSQFDTTFGALYFPWLDVLDPLPGDSALTLSIPPCGHVAGLIAATDLTLGVHKAPANVLLLQAERATFALDSAGHGLLNAEGINCIRGLSGRGLRVAGARIVTSRTDLRFLNVRRLLLMIERALEVSLQWAVFEPNNWLTRAKITLVIDSFLRELWTQGAMMGATAAEAYFVRCDESNNDADARARGELHIEIGVAPSVPFEFVVVRVGRAADSFEMTEADPAGG